MTDKQHINVISFDEPGRIDADATHARHSRTVVIEAYEGQVCEYESPLQIAIGLMRGKLFRDAINAEYRLEIQLSSEMQAVPTTEPVASAINSYLQIMRRLRMGILEESSAQRRTPKAP